MHLPRQHFNGFLIASLSSRRFVFLLAATIAAANGSAADGQSNRYAAQQIRISKARPVASRKVVDADASAIATKPSTVAARPIPKRGASTLARAATGQALGELPPKPLDGSLVAGKVAQTGYYESYAAAVATVSDRYAIVALKQPVESNHFAAQK